jgi:hypothetical protein
VKWSASEDFTSWEVPPDTHTLTTAQLPSHSTPCFLGGSHRLFPLHDGEMWCMDCGKPIKD